MNKELSSEAKLKAIIKAQGIGQSLELIELKDDGVVLFKDDNHVAPWPVLRILLDTQGCKASYGDTLNYWRKGNELVKNRQDEICRAPEYKIASEAILEAWHSGEGNSWKEAINVAYSLLPDEN